MLSKENMYAAIREWVLNPTKRTVRIHLSHTDADGYCCQLVTKFMNYVKCNFDSNDFFGEKERKYKGENRIFYGNIDPGGVDDVEAQQDEIESIINQLADDPVRYYPGVSILSFLVTDVGNFNPKEVFAPFIAAGHRIQYLVVDHHVDRDGLADGPQAYELKVYEENVSTHSYWFTFQDAAACQHMAMAFYKKSGVENVKSFLSSKYRALFYDDVQLETRMNHMASRLGRLSALCESIGLADTGNFGVWNIDEFDKVDPVAAARLLWGYYSYTDAMCKLYLEDQYRMLIGDDVHREHMHNIFDLITRNEHQRVLEEYKTFESEIKSRPANITAIIDPNVVDDYIKEMFKGYKVCVCYLRTMTGMRKYPNFSMLAKSYLSQNTQIDIILGYDSLDYSYSLRSYKNDVNVADIARRSSGGGHPRAAGFTHITDANAK